MLTSPYAGIIQREPEPDDCESAAPIQSELCDEKGFRFRCGVCIGSAILFAGILLVAMHLAPRAWAVGAALSEKTTVAGGNCESFVDNSTTPAATVQTDGTSKYTLQDLLQRRPGLPVYIFTTDNYQGRQRMRNVKKQCRELGLHCMRQTPSTKPKLPALLEEAMTAYTNMSGSSNEVALMAEDDTLFIPNFLDELSRSVQDLPAGWTVFHLGSGWLWGRGESHDLHDFSLHPLGQFDREPEPTLSPNGRAYLNPWPRCAVSGPYCQYGDADGILPGAPCVYLVKQKGVSELRAQLEPKLWQEQYPIDMFLRDAAKQYPCSHFLAAQPPLCREYPNSLR